MKPPESLRCPGCGNPSSIISHGERYAVYPSGYLALIGPFIAPLHQASCPVDFECGACRRTFSVRSASARFCLGVLVLLGLRIVLDLLQFLLTRE